MRLEFKIAREKVLNGVSIPLILVGVILLYSREKLKLYEELGSIYENFSDAAEKRFTSGETTVLEKINAESLYQQTLSEQHQAESDLQIYREDLQYLLGVDIPLMFKELPLEKLPAGEFDQTHLAANPILAYFDQSTVMAEENYRLEKQGYLPDLTLGYINQQMEGKAGFHAFHLGIAVPLFYGSQKSRIQAAEIEIDIARQEYEDQYQSISRQFRVKEQALQKHLTKLQWYEQQGLTGAGELLRFADAGYRRGEIDYVEYLNSVSQAVKIRFEYPDAIHQYNQTVLDINFLINGL